jgi:hypothetical protein
VKFGIIMDVEASRAIRQAEVGAAKTMIERTEASPALVREVNPLSTERTRRCRVVYQHLLRSGN